MATDWNKVRFDLLCRFSEVFFRSFGVTRRSSILMVLMDPAIIGGISVRNLKSSVVATSVADLSWYGALSLPAER
jgi:hypothetical protein